jgi:hypothetical protein
MIAVLAGLAWAIPPEDATGWAEYASGEYRTECITWDGQPWCRAFGRSKAPIDVLGDLIEDRAAYPKVYGRVPKTEILDATTNVFRLCLDLPSIIGDRDEVVQAERDQQGDVRIYRWSSIVHPKGPEEPGYMRLKRASGEWRLTPKDGYTELRYTWQAEMQGHLPNWILHRIWAATGPEIMGETIVAAEKKGR